MAPSETLRVDAAFRIAGVTPGVDNCLPLGADDLGRDLAEALPEYGWLLDDVRTALAGGDAGGHIRDCEARGRYRFSARPMVGGGAVVTMIDEADRLANESRLAQSNAEFLALVEASGQVVWRTDDQGKAVRGGPTWEPVADGDPDAWRAQDWIGEVHPDDAAAMAERWAEAVREQTLYEAEFRILDPETGAWRWATERGVPLTASDGAFIGHIGINTDIDDSRRGTEALRASERRFRALVEATAETVWESDAEGRIVDASPGWEATTGQGGDDYVGDGWLDVVHPDDKEELVEAWGASTSAGIPYEGEFRIRIAADGSWRWTRSRAVPLFDADGTLEGYIGTTTDISARREAEEAVRASERRFRALVEASAETVWEADPEGRPTGDSSQWRTFTGQTRGEAEGLGWLEAVHHEDLAGVLAAWKEAVEAGTPGDFEFRVRRASDGMWRRLTTRVVPLLDADGTVEGYVGMNTDITERREAEEALRSSERRFRALVAVSSEIVWEGTVGSDGGIVFRDSPSWRAFTGQSQAEWQGEGWLEAIHPDDREMMAEAWRRSVETGEPYDIECRVRRASDGAWRWMTSRAAPLHRADGTVEGYVGMNTDVTERREAVEALRASEARFRAMAETVPDILFTVEATGKVSYVSTLTFAEQTGVDPYGLKTAEDWTAMAHPEDGAAMRAAWAESFATGQPFEFRYRSGRDGTYRWTIVRARLVASDDGGPPRWYGAATDIDDLARAEVALTEANETLEARVRAETDRVRQLSAALAVAEQSERRRIADVLHDDLQQQLYGLALLVSRLLSDPAAEEREALLVRCEEIVEDTIAIGRGLATELAPPALESSDARDLARWLASETERLHGLSVDVEAKGPCQVSEMAVRSLIYRTLRELLFNVAKHADVERACLRVGVEAGWLRVEVEDDGRGFETTTTDHGYGLGSIRERLDVAGGCLEVASAPGAGTCIRLAIPSEGAPEPGGHTLVAIGRT